MAGNPVLKAYIDFDDDNVLDAGEDVSQYAVGDPGERILDVQRGANFEGGTATPGSMALKLFNGDNRFTPGNTSGPYGSNVKQGKRIRVDAVYSGTPKPLFVGRITQIVPNDQLPMSVDILAEDKLSKADRMRVPAGLTAALSISAFRQQLLDAAFGAGSSALSGSGPENTKLTLGSDAESLQDVLADLNEATRSIDFIRPVASPTFGETGSLYVTKDRATMQGLAAVASYAADQIASMNGWEANDREKVNYQLVQAEPYVSAEVEEEIWRAGKTIGIQTGTTRIKIARWSDPLIIGKGRRPAERTRLAFTASGTANANANFYSTSAKITMTGGALGGVLRDLRILGFPADQRGLGFEESDLSAGDPQGVYAGADVSSRFLANDADAKGLADYLTWLGTQPLIVHPTITLKRNLFPDILEREPGERITVAHGRLGLTAQDILIESTQLQMIAGGDWRLTITGRKFPFQSVFTIGGDAAHGIGGSGVLAY